MTSAVIYLDPAAIRPVIDGMWHLTRFTAAVPVPGDEIETLCGASALVEYAPMAERTARRLPTQCWYCDVEHRRALGWEIRPDHPGLQPRSGRR